ncbi:hypothetical protein CYMTET_15301 [Cymbomonas tetramitiformis]|uniref:Uncharacterized protein n=1 Tax=Cymbomonas tetramitiformis TaxID=36881 RepID=A0AAE0GER1_9CHLO|nr:hypothetical protein CYMTET_15301 [Cymbomonas tetramitiformis]
MANFTSRVSSVIEYLCCVLGGTVKVALGAEPLAQAPVPPLAQPVVRGAKPLAPLITHNAEILEHGAKPAAQRQILELRAGPQVRDELRPAPPAHGAGPKTRGPALHLVQLLVHTAEPLEVHGTMELAQSAQQQLQLGSALLVTTAAHGHRATRCAADSSRAREAAVGAVMQSCRRAMNSSQCPIQCRHCKPRSRRCSRCNRGSTSHNRCRCTTRRNWCRARAEQLLEHVERQVRRRQTHEIRLGVRTVTAQLGMQSSAATQHGKPLERGSQWRKPRAKPQSSDQLETTQLLELRVGPQPRGELEGLRRRNCINETGTGE